MIWSRMKHNIVIIIFYIGAAIYLALSIYSVGKYFVARFNNNKDEMAKFINESPKHVKNGYKIMIITLIFMLITRIFITLFDG